MMTQATGKTGDGAELWKGREAQKLVRALLGLRTPAEAKRFLRDLLTEDEIRMMIARWQVARMLSVGASYREIEEDTGLSTRTIARISKWLKEGEGGYRMMLTRGSAKGTGA